MPFNAAPARSSALEALFRADGCAPAEDGYTFDLKGLSKDVTAERLRALFEKDAPSIRITMAANAPSPPALSTSSSASLHSSTTSSASGSFFLKPPSSFNRTAELRVTSLQDAISLQNLQPRLETYGLSLQMKERAQDSAPRWQDTALGTHDVQQFTSRGLGSFEKRWPAELPRDDSGMAQYGPGGWRDAKDPQQIGDAFWGYESDDHIPSMSSWSPWSDTTTASTSTLQSDPNADRLGARNLYVLNLPVSLSQIEFEKMFAQIGNVEHACLLSMLDQNGRRRGFLLMRTHKEAREVIRQAHGRMLEGSQLDISWARVQKGTVSEIQRGATQGIQRFVPPPLAPTSTRQEPASYPSYRPTTGWIMASTMPRSTHHPIHPPRVLSPKIAAPSYRPHAEGFAIEYNLPMIVIIQPTSPYCTLHSVTTEASKYGNIIHTCILSLGHSAFVPFNDYPYDDPTLGTASNSSYAIRFHHTASAETATRMLPVLHGWHVRTAVWSDIDQLASNDRQLMLHQPSQKAFSSMAPSTTQTSHHSMLNALHARPFIPAGDANTTPKASRPPAMFTTPVSPLSDYPKLRDFTASSHHIGSLSAQECIWKHPTDAWPKLREVEADGDSDVPLPPTPIIKSTQPDSSVEIVSPSAVWWNGVLRLDDDDTQSLRVDNSVLSVKQTVDLAGSKGDSGAAAES